MKKPEEYLEWASNDNHPVSSNPWSELSNKVRPTNSQLKAGRIPGDKPPAEFTNWFRNLTAKYIGFLSGLRLSNWSESTISTGPDVQKRIACTYDPSVDILVAYIVNGLGPYEIFSRDQGISWLDDGPDPLLAGISDKMDLCGAATDENGRRYLITRGATLNAIYRSADHNSFFEKFDSFDPLWSDQVLEAVDADFGSSNVIVVGHLGNVAVSTDGGANFTGVSGLDVISGVDKLVGLKHTKDPDNPSWLIVTTANSYICDSDPKGSVNWKSYPHSFPFLMDVGVSHNNALYYDKSYKRFVLIVGDKDIAYSDDRGATWVTLSGVLPEEMVPNKVITGDGYGEVLVTGFDSFGNIIIASSEDGGLTWTKRNLIHPMTITTSDKPLSAFAGHRFVIIDGGTTLDAHVSLAL